MKYKLVHTNLVLLLICLISCDRPECNNENSIFETNEPNSKIYKDELVNQLNRIDKSKLIGFKSMMSKMEKKLYILTSKEMDCVQFYI